MINKTVVVTGAHSYLGQKLIQHLLDIGGFEIAAFITPWADENGLISGTGVRYFKADLRNSLAEDHAAAVRNADSILHFAWIRGTDEKKVLGENLEMFRNIKEHISDPEKVVFISSVAASPKTLSAYGRIKFKAANVLLEYGAVILVTGLIVDKVPKGPYKLLVSVVKKLPFSVRFTKNSVRVYPIRTDDFLNAITTVLNDQIPGGSYRVYPADPADINDFLAELEKKYRRTRIPLPVSYRFSMGALKAFRRIGLMPATLGEKLLTFLYKDDEYLATIRQLPGATDLERPLNELI